MERKAEDSDIPGLTNEELHKELKRIDESLEGAPLFVDVDGFTSTEYIVRSTRVPDARLPFSDQQLVRRVMAASRKRMERGESRF